MYEVAIQFAAFSAVVIATVLFMVKKTVTYDVEFNRF